MTDLLQALIDAGAIPSSPFGPNSRYQGVPLAVYQPDPNVLGVPYVRRRFIAQRKDIAVAASVAVGAGDRPELIATRTLGEPLLYWRVADANAVTDPFELSDTPGERVAIPLPPGMTG